MRRITAILVAVLVSGCATAYRIDELNMTTRLREVTANGAPLQGGTAGAGVGDAVVRFLAVQAAEGAVLLEIENLSSSTIRVVWDEGSYVGVDGFASRVVPGETRVLDVARSQPITPIPPQAKAQLWAISTRENSEEGSRLPDRAAVRALCERLPGSEIRLVLPVESPAGRREYNLRFAIESVQVRAVGAGGGVARESCPAEPAAP